MAKWPQGRSSSTSVNKVEGFCESFNGALREGLFNGGFCNPKSTRFLVEQWRQHCNQVRPHSSLSCRPPAPQVILQAKILPIYRQHTCH
ncbi:transposase [Polynucleobacter sp. 86C-FISCH]|nr:transposase [Polynucleobacter sp. 86C-FISCH]